VPLARWSLAEIVQQLIALGLVTAIALSTVSRWFVQERLRPWRYHSWQHILDPQAFLERARPVLRLYERAQELLTQGRWVVCADEKTSIQARERDHPPRPAQAERPLRFSPRYQRHGARQLFAALSVADGQVYGQCRARKCFRDFCAFLTAVLLPEALRRGVHTIALILDNGTTHAPKQLEAWLATLPAVQEGQLTIQVYWLPKNASWLDQIEIWFSILQRKLLQPNHFASLEVLEKAILAFIKFYNAVAKPIHWTYTVEKLEKKLGQN